MIKGSIFDIGGVLVNDTHTLLLKLISEQFNKEFYKVQNAVEEAVSGLELAEITEREFCTSVASRLDISAVNELEKLFGSHYKENVKIDRKVEELVLRLKKEGYALAVLSNTVSSHAEYNRKNRFYDYFDIILLSSEVGLRKPDKRFFHLALERLDLAPNECIFIDDIESHIAAAKELGIHGIHYRNCSQLERELREVEIRF